jgi:PAS domain S-box-containing protein
MDVIDEKELRAAYEGTRKRLDELTILYEMTRISTESLNLDQILTEIVKALNRFFQFDELTLLLVDEHTQEWILPPLCAGLGGSLHDQPRSWQDNGIARAVVESREPLWLKDARKGEEVISEIYVPIKAGNKTIGLLEARSKSSPAFSEEGFRLLTLVGEHLARIIENVRSEERYRAFVESALDGVVVIGVDGRLIYANERLAELLGFGREELIGTDCRDFLDEESYEVLFGERALRDGGNGSSRGEIGIFRKDGGRREVEVSFTSILDSQGNGNTVVFLKDVTEKKKMEEQLLQAEKLRAVGEMASGVAHDFNNALTIILGSTQLLLLNPQDEESRETLRTIERAAKGSSYTVRRLLDFTREEVHKELLKLDINSILREAVDSTKPKWQEDVPGRATRIDIGLNLGEVLPVVGNASEFKEVAMNLISNAVEAMPEGGKIRIRTYADEKTVYLQISDTGTGMSDEVKKKVFEPFFTTKPFAHTGLGMSVLYGIVKRFKGNIDVNSEMGQGTTVTLSFPAVPEPQWPVSSSPPVKKRRGARVLVIDDEAHIRDILSRILSKAEHQVSLATSGEEGLQLFQEKEFDLVLTDLGMPRMSGWEVCQAIKQAKPQIPVGMITGWGAEVEQAQIEAKGVDFLIFKPFDFTHILDKVAEVVA